MCHSKSQDAVRQAATHWPSGVAPELSTAPRLQYTRRLHVQADVARAAVVDHGLCRRAARRVSACQRPGRCVAWLRVSTHAAMPTRTIALRGVQLLRTLRLSRVSDHRRARRVHACNAMQRRTAASNICKTLVQRRLPSAAAGCSRSRHARAPSPKRVGVYSSRARQKLRTSLRASQV